MRVKPVFNAGEITLRIEAESEVEAYLLYVFRKPFSQEGVKGILLLDGWTYSQGDGGGVSALTIHCEATPAGEG